MEEFSESKARQSEAPADERLDSWKEIATYLDRDVRTVQRWEQEEGLPIRRHIHNTQVSVYAYRSEIDAWLGKRSTGLDKHEPAHGLRFFSENKKTVAGVAGGVTLLLLVGLVAWMDIGSSSNPEALNFQQRDWVLIADFENRTAESVFDGVLEYALEREISNSQFVNVVPRERIEDTLQLMRKPLDTRIDRTLGREICLRDGGIKALLTGRVEKLDSTYLLSVQVVDPSQGQAIATASEEAVGQKQVLSALRSLSNWAGENLGEKLALIQESERKLEKAATPSLRAVQLYTDARTLFDRGGIGQGPAEELLRQALEIDPEFASAYIWLAWTLRNQGESFDDYIQHAKRAFQLAGTTSEQERYFIHGSYYWMKGELDRAIHAFEALLGLYPDHFWATHKLAVLYSETGQEQRALTYWLRRADLRPNHFNYNRRAVLSLLGSGRDLVQAQPYLDRARNLITPEDIKEDNNRPAIRIMLVPAYEAWLGGDPQAALVEIEKVSQTLNSLGMSERDSQELGNLYQALGKRQLAREWFTKGLDSKSRHWRLAKMAAREGDYEKTRSHLKQYLETTYVSGHAPPMVNTQNFSAAVILARSGFFSESEKILLEWERRHSKEDTSHQDPFIEMGWGILKFSRGNTAEGIEMLEGILQRLPVWHFAASAILAEAYRLQGDLLAGIQLLEEASKKRPLLVGSLGPPASWLRIKSQLADLYRDEGRYEDARKIEDELRRLLALADSDHPILRQLDRTEDLALREPAKN
ncbi:tetratricopeptide repeat protein [Acidobacteria bacterium AH-259-O06]|nr:tetratricopeptide repeat protein [Acidobacteria bacterium AH-259-O06]